MIELALVIYFGGLFMCISKNVRAHFMRLCVLPVKHILRVVLHSPQVFWGSFLAVCFLVGGVVFLSFIDGFQHLLAEPWAEFIILSGAERLESSRNIALGMLALVGIVLATWRTWAQNRLTKTDRQRHAMEAYNAALKNLESKKHITSMGAIMALEKLAKDMPSFHDFIFEILCNFIQTETSVFFQEEENDKSNRLSPSKYVSSSQAFIAITRRNQSNDISKQLIELNFTYITSLILHEVNLRNAMFIESTLRHMEFLNGNLENANFLKTKMEDVEFYSSSLRRAKFDYANLTRVSFKKSDLCGVNFSGTTLNDVDFFGAILSDAILPVEALGNESLKEAIGTKFKTEDGKEHTLPYISEVSD